MKEILDKLAYSADPQRTYSFGISDLGQRRKLNEDNLLIDEKLGLFVIADGMGGHDAGEIASKLSVEIIFNHIKAATLKNLDEDEANNDLNVSRIIQDAIEAANNQVHCYNLAKGAAEGKGMGTTVTGFWISPANNGEQLQVFNVGDSRVYQFQDNELLQLTTDHSHYQLWIETGKEGPAPTQNIIYKALGPWRRILPEQHTITIKKPSLFLLCSDGLSDMLDHERLKTLLTQLQNQPLEKLSRILVDEANKAGGKDNISLIVVKF